MSPKKRVRVTLAAKESPLETFRVPTRKATCSLCVALVLAHIREAETDQRDFAEVTEFVFVAFEWGLAHNKHFH